MNKILGVTLLVLALAISITPQFLDCNAQGHVMTMANGKTVPMVCLWTARAEIAEGIPLFAAGVMMFLARRKESLQYLNILGIILGICVMLLPTVLIGVCDTTMVCTTVMRPSLLTFGSLVILTSLIGILLSMRKEK